MKIPSTRMPAKLMGIYFLYDGDKLVYIGQSKSILARIGQHMNTEKPFDSYALIECDEEDLDSMEAQYIRHYQPPLNVVGANTGPVPPSWKITPAQMDRIVSSPLSDHYWARRLKIPEDRIKYVRQHIH